MIFFVSVEVFYGIQGGKRVKVNFYVTLKDLSSLALLLRKDGRGGCGTDQERYIVYLARSVC